MSRVIKFRAWHKEQKIMEYPYGLIVERHIYVHNAGIQTWQLDEIELMQFTDLKDREGKEVYEGDIVYNPDYDEKGVVTWVNTLAGFLIMKPDQTTAFVLHSAWEVIGNIYEHPERVR